MAWHGLIGLFVGLGDVMRHGIFQVVEDIVIRIPWAHNIKHNKFSKVSLVLLCLTDINIEWWLVCSCGGDCEVVTTISSPHLTLLSRSPALAWRLSQTTWAIYLHQLSSARKETLQLATNYTVWESWISIMIQSGILGITNKYNAISNFPPLITIESVGLLYM